MKLTELAELIKAELILPEGVPTTEIKGVAPIAHAKAGDVTFIANAEYAKYLATTGASAVILPARHAEFKGAQLVHKNPYWAFAKTAQVFFPPKKETPGISPKAHVDPTAEVAKTATVYPFAYIGAHARIGERSVVYPGAFIGDGAQIGDDTVLRANAVVEYGVKVGNRVLVHGGSVLGADGFGFAPGDDGLAKIPQIGSVVVADEVEIGGLCTVDRGAMENTKVGYGTKLDSHVHVGHGAVLGEHCMMCGFAGLAGSAKVGNRVILAGHSAVDNRVEIADGSILGAMSALTRDATEKDTYLGFPAIPAGEWRRQTARLRRLGDLEAKVKELEKKLEAVLK